MKAPPAALGIQRRAKKKSITSRLGADRLDSGIRLDSHELIPDVSPRHGLSAIPSSSSQPSLRTHTQPPCRAPYLYVTSVSAVTWSSYLDSHVPSNTQHSNAYTTRSSRNGPHRPCDRIYSSRTSSASESTSGSRSISHRQRRRSSSRRDVYSTSSKTGGRRRYGSRKRQRPDALDEADQTPQ